MKKYHILIKDASKGRFRVCQMAPTGEMINQSEALETVDNVFKNILAAERIINPLAPSASKYRTQKQRFERIVHMMSRGIWNIKYIGKYDYMFGPAFK